LPLFSAKLILIPVKLNDDQSFFKIKDTVLKEINLTEDVQNFSILVMSASVLQHNPVNENIKNKE
jgi:hypothetical protein